jgi:hypothetical protein
MKVFFRLMTSPSIKAVFIKLWIVIKTLILISVQILKTGEYLNFHLILNRSLWKRRMEDEYEKSLK